MMEVAVALAIIYLTERARRLVLWANACYLEDATDEDYERPWRKR